MTAMIAIAFFALGTFVGAVAVGLVVSGRLGEDDIE